MRPQKPTRDPHGTNNRYVAGCSCIACCDAHSQYMRESRNGRQYNPRMVSTVRARQHIKRLSRRITVTEVARRAAVDRHTVASILSGQPLARRQTIEAIMSVRAPRVGERKFDCRQCGTEVHITEPTDKRTVYCSAQCEKQYWRHITKRRPTALTVHKAWERQWREQVGA